MFDPNSRCWATPSPISPAALEERRAFIEWRIANKLQVCMLPRRIWRLQVPRSILVLRSPTADIPNSQAPRMPPQPRHPRLTILLEMNAARQRVKARRGARKRLAAIGIPEIAYRHLIDIKSIEVLNAIAR